MNPETGEARVATSVNKRLLIASTALLLGATALAPHADAAPIHWLNPAAGDWFDAANWTAGVPTSADDAFISNGGTAQVSGAVTPVARQLHIGAGAGPVSTGTVIVSGLDLEVGQELRVGTAGAGATATGTLDVDGDLTGAGGAVFDRFAIGEVSGPGSSQAFGTTRVDGDMTAVNNGTVGVIATGGDGDRAEGSLAVGGSLSGLTRVGLAINSAEGDASSAGGSVIVDNGDIILGNGPFFVGVARNGGSVADGVVESQNGTLRTQGPFQQVWEIGSGIDGEGTGRVIAGAVDTSANIPTRITVGFGAEGGTGRGELRFADGTLDVGGDVVVGLANSDTGGVARGILEVGDLLRASGSDRFLGAGYVFGGTLAGLGQGEAEGTIEAGGIEGFRTVWIGVSATHRGQDVTATGNLSVGAAGLINSNPLDAFGAHLLIGIANARPVNNEIAGPGGTGTGNATIGGDISGYALVEVGVVTNSGTADGMLHLHDGTLTTGRLRVGVAVPPSGSLSAADAALHATGKLTVSDGAIVLSPNAGGLPGIADIGAKSSSSDGVDSTAQGELELSNSAFTGGFLRVGLSGGTGLVTAANSSTIEVNLLTVGTGGAGSGKVEINDSVLTTQVDPTVNGAAGNLLAGLDGATGVVEANNSTITVGGGLFVTTGFADPGASGRVSLTNSTMEVAGNAGIGGITPGSRGELALSNSTADIGGNLFLGGSANAGALFGDAVLSVDASLLTVGGLLQMDSGAETLFAVAGLDRGLGGYGAIDADSLRLMGDVIVDFTDLGPLADFLVLDFDFIITPDLDAIMGDFASVDLLNLPAGYIANYGIFEEDEFATWRVRLTLRDQLAVSEPAALALLLIGLFGLGLARRNRSRSSFN